MPPVKRATRRSSAKKVQLSPEALEEIVEVRAERMVRQHTIFDLKMILALAVIGVASIAMNVLASTTSTPSATEAAPVAPVATGRLVVNVKNTSATNSRIVLPAINPNAVVTSSASVGQTHLGGWDVSAEVEPVALKKVSFSAINTDFTVRTTAGEFKQMYLYNNAGELLGSGPLVNGTVQFMLNNYVIDPGKTETLSLKTVVLGSSFMKPNSMIRFGVNLQVANQWQAVGVNSGKNLSFTSIKFNTINYAIGALSNFNLYHLSIPVVYGPSSWSSSAVKTSVESKISSHRMMYTGEREVRVSKLMFNVSQVGMINTGVSSTSGVVKDFKLYESDGQNGLGKLLAVGTSCLVAQPTTTPKVNKVVIPGVGTCDVDNTYVSFDKNNDIDSAFDTFYLSSTTARNLVVVANTANAGNGLKAASIIRLATEIKGNTGPMATTNPKITLWNGGGIFYHYAPVGKTENVSAYNQLDSYPINKGYALTLMKI
ncbi:MAG: hypothetical protein KAZ30_04465 [Candidatus Magasanikbacteria bacterium]|nr:hypothetical protein [Candidatus Magasanikbacteria bacterium]